MRISIPPVDVLIVMGLCSRWYEKFSYSLNFASRFYFVALLWIGLGIQLCSRLGYHIWQKGETFSNEVILSALKHFFCSSSGYRSSYMAAAVIISIGMLVFMKMKPAKLEIGRGQEINRVRRDYILKVTGKSMSYGLGLLGISFIIFFVGVLAYMTLDKRFDESSPYWFGVIFAVIYLGINLLISTIGKRIFGESMWRMSAGATRVEYGASIVILQFLILVLSTGCTLLVVGLAQRLGFLDFVL